MFPTTLVRDSRSGVHVLVTAVTSATGKAKGGSTWFGNMLASVEGYELRWPMRWRTADAATWDDFTATNLYPEIAGEFRNQFAVIKGLESLAEPAKVTGCYRC